MKKFLERFEFWVFRKLIRRHMEVHMDQFDLYKMRLKWGNYGYITLSKSPEPGTDESYFELE